MADPPYSLSLSPHSTPWPCRSPSCFSHCSSLIHIFTHTKFFVLFTFFWHHIHYVFFLSFQKILEITSSVLQPFKTDFHQEATNIFFFHFHFQEKFIEEFQAGESGIVLKPLNARLSTCILKNEQKKKNKKREKIKQCGEFKMVVFSK